MPRGPLAFLAGRTAAAVLPALFLLTSCAVPDQHVVAQQGGRLDDLQVRMLRLERSMAEAQGGARAPSPADPELNRRLADLGQRVEAAEEQLRALGGRVDELGRSASAAPVASPRLPALETTVADLARRVEGLERRPSAPSSPLPAPAAAAPTPAAPPPSMDSQALYDQARDAFRQYIERFPDTPLTDNAFFWVGESYYDQRQYEQAILEYDKVVQKFPTGDKVAGALLKQAFAFDAIGDPVDARILLKKLLREHPSSEQATIAKKKLEILGE